MAPRRALPLSALFFLAVLSLSLAASQWHHMPAGPSPSEKQEETLSIGKKLFMERCGRCHDERGDKPLPEGPPLNERELTREEIARAVRGRFRDKTDEERAAVVAYMESFLKSKPQPVPDQ